MPWTSRTALERSQHGLEQEPAGAEQAQVDGAGTASAELDPDLRLRLEAGLLHPIHQPQPIVGRQREKIGRTEYGDPGNRSTHMHLPITNDVTNDRLRTLIHCEEHPADVL